MALFRVFQGPEDTLGEVPVHDGYAYFTVDRHNFYIDFDGVRHQINAKGATGIFNKKQDGSYDITDIIDIDDLMLSDAIIPANQGGTGKTSLTLNAILIGNGTDPVKMVSAENNALLMGDSVNGVKSKTVTNNAILAGDNTNGIKEISGIGILYAIAGQAPQFGIAPIEVGGTGGNTKEKARQSLEVYSSEQVDDKVDEVTSMSFNATLTSAGWQQASDVFTFDLPLADITCGKNGNVPPIITWVTNLEDYSKIDKAEATKGEGILFTASKKPADDIQIIITDNR